MGLLNFGGNFQRRRKKACSFMTLIIALKPEPEPVPGLEIQDSELSLKLSIYNTPMCQPVLGSPGSSVGRALDLRLEGCRFESGIGKSMWDYFHIFCSMCRPCLSEETQNRGPESIA